MRDEWTSALPSPLCTCWCRELDISIDDYRKQEVSA